MLVISSLYRFINEYDTYFGNIVYLPWPIIDYIILQAYTNLQLIVYNGYYNASTILVRLYFGQIAMSVLTTSLIYSWNLRELMNEDDNIK